MVEEEGRLEGGFFLGQDLGFLRHTRTHLSLLITLGRGIRSRIRSVVPPWRLGTRPGEGERVHVCLFPHRLTCIMVYVCKYMCVRVCVCRLESGGGVSGNLG